MIKSIYPHAFRSICLVIALSGVSPVVVVGDESVGQRQAATVMVAEDSPAGQLEKRRDVQASVSDLSESDFHGFVQRDFKMNGVACKLVSPMASAPNAPWIWRARFWGHEPQLDLALLQRGWHVCYCDVADLFGNETAVGRWDQFYELTQQIGLHSKPLLEGMSRGGLIVMRWASSNPDRVSGIYIDNAVMDIRSWPGGKGDGIGAPRAWKSCLDAYQITEEESKSIEDGPLRRLDDLAKARVPIFALINEADSVVPPSENSNVLIQRYRDLGGTVQEIRRPRLGHHPHSLKDPAALVDFAMQAVAK